MPAKAHTPSSQGVAMNGPAASSGVDHLSLYDPDGIELEDISLVDFVREWGRAVTRTALAHAAAKRQPALE